MFDVGLATLTESLLPRHSALLCIRVGKITYKCKDCRDRPRVTATVHGWYFYLTQDLCNKTMVRSPDILSDCTESEWNDGSQWRQVIQPCPALTSRSCLTQHPSVLAPEPPVPQLAPHAVHISLMSLSIIKQLQNKTLCSPDFCPCGGAERTDAQQMLATLLNALLEGAQIPRGWAQWKKLPRTGIEETTLGEPQIVSQGTLCSVPRKALLDPLEFCRIWFRMFSVSRETSIHMGNLFHCWHGIWFIAGITPLWNETGD